MTLWEMIIYYTCLNQVKDETDRANSFCLIAIYRNRVNILANIIIILAVFNSRYVYKRIRKNES